MKFRELSILEWLFLAVLFSIIVVLCLFLALYAIRCGWKKPAGFIFFCCLLTMFIAYCELKRRGLCIVCHAVKATHYNATGYLFCEPCFLKYGVNGLPIDLEESDREELAKRMIEESKKEHESRQRVKNNVVWILPIFALLTHSATVPL